MFPRSTLYLFRQTRINDSNPISLRPDLFPISHPISLFPLPDLKIPSKKSPTLSPPPPRRTDPGGQGGCVGWVWVFGGCARRRRRRRRAVIISTRAERRQMNSERRRKRRRKRGLKSPFPLFLDSSFFSLLFLQRQQRRQVDPFHAAIASFKAGGGAKGEGREVLQEVMPN